LTGRGRAVVTIVREKAGGYELIVTGSAGTSGSEPILFDNNLSH